MTHNTEGERAALLSCPFCKNEATDYYRPSGWYISCTRCNASTCITDTREQAAEYWNRRAPAAPVPQGWKLVPISPTQEQLRAGYWSGAGEIRLHEEWARKESYERMVQNAPMTSPAAAPQEPK